MFDSSVTKNKLDFNCVKINTFVVTSPSFNSSSNSWRLQNNKQNNSLALHRSQLLIHQSHKYLWQPMQKIYNNRLTACLRTMHDLNEWNYGTISDNILTNILEKRLNFDKDWHKQYMPSESAEASEAESYSGSINTGELVWTLFNIGGSKIAPLPEVNMKLCNNLSFYIRYQQNSKAMSGRAMWKETYLQG